MRRWVFTASKHLSVAECQTLNSLADAFISTWLSHGTPVRATHTLDFNCILSIELQADSSSSGCSTDVLFRFIKMLETELQCEWLNRKHVLLKRNNSFKIFHADSLPKHIPYSELKHFFLFDTNAFCMDGTMLPWVTADATWLKSVY